MFGGLGQVGSQAAMWIATGGLGSTVLLSAQGTDIVASELEQKGLSDEAYADIISVAGGFGTGLLEKASLNRIFRHIPASEVNRFAKMLKSAGTEGTQEILENMWHSLVQMGIDPKETLIDDNTGYEGAVGASVGAILGLLMPGRAKIVDDANSVADSIEASEQLLKISEGLAPETKADIQQKLVEDEVDSVEIDPRAFKKHKLRGQLVQAVGPEKWLDAVVNDTTVSLSKEEYANLLGVEGMADVIVDAKYNFKEKGKPLSLREALESVAGEDITREETDVAVAVQKDNTKRIAEASEGGIDKPTTAKDFQQILRLQVKEITRERFEHQLNFQMDQTPDPDVQAAVNGWFRSDTVAKITAAFKKKGKITDPVHKKIINSINRAASPLTEDFVLWRGSGQVLNPTTKKGWQVGEIFSTPIPLSTSAMLNTGRMFGNNEPKSVLWRIAAPKGSQAVIFNSSETEMLLPGNFKLKIVDVKNGVAFTGFKGKVVYAELQAQDEDIQKAEEYTEQEAKEQEKVLKKIKTKMKKGETASSAHIYDAIKELSFKEARTLQVALNNAQFKAVLAKLQAVTKRGSLTQLTQQVKAIDKELASTYREWDLASENPKESSRKFPAKVEKLIAQKQKLEAKIDKTLELDPASIPAADLVQTRASALQSIGIQYSDTTVSRVERATKEAQSPS